MTGIKSNETKTNDYKITYFISTIKSRKQQSKLQNEIRQIAYSLYRSNILSKTIYNNLINTI